MSSKVFEKIISQERHSRILTWSDFVSILTWSSNDNWVHNQKLIFTKIVITNFYEKLTKLSFVNNLETGGLTNFYLTSFIYLFMKDFRWGSVLFYWLDHISLKTVPQRSSRKFHQLANLFSDWVRTTMLQRPWVKTEEKWSLPIFSVSRNFHNEWRRTDRNA